jgi:hypothetical protein
MHYYYDTRYINYTQLTLTISPKMRQNSRGEQDPSRRSHEERRAERRRGGECSTSSRRERARSHRLRAERRQIGLSLPGVRLVTLSILAVIK